MKRRKNEEKRNRRNEQDKKKDRNEPAEPAMTMANPAHKDVLACLDVWS